MKEYLPQKSVVLKISRLFLVTVLVFSWIFSGWPQIWHNPPFPPNIQKSKAAIIFDRTPSALPVGGQEANILLPVPINISVVFPDDLVYDGSIGSVGLTLEPLLKMRWWGIAVYNETDNFVFGCVSTTLPLPAANFNLGPGDYKTAISLGETKEDCEAFNTAEYPLFAVIGAANFTLK